MTEQTDSMVQSIIDRNRKEAKHAQEKATAIGGAIAFGGFQLAVPARPHSDACACGPETEEGPRGPSGRRVPRGPGMAIPTTALR